MAEKKITTTLIDSVKKLQSKVIMGAEIKNVEDGNMYIVSGKATGMKGGESNYGPWECLTGEFKAERIVDGKIFSSNVVFLPDVAHMQIAHVLKSGEAEAVDFVFAIGRITSDNSATGFEYTCTPLVQPEIESDPVMALLETGKALLKEQKLLETGTGEIKKKPDEKAK